MRLDLLLVERKFFESRAKAREAIEAGLVFVDGAQAAKPSQMADPDAEIAAEAPYPWVSRGGVKLAAALKNFGFDPKDQICLDIGASTGGFCDVLLTHGAKKIYAVDVGFGQLHPKLLQNSRIQNMEKCDARLLTAADVGAPNFLTFDVSFISLTKIAPHVLSLAGPHAQCVALVKPQFEVGPQFVKKGIVRDKKAQSSAVQTIKRMFENLNWRIVGETPSPITGGDGNVEFLLGAQKL